MMMNGRRCGLLIALPNLLTLLRAVSACILSFYLSKHFGQLMIPAILFSLILLTDFLDGRIARLFYCTSRFGAILDVSADLLYIVLIYNILCKYNVLPMWFFIILLTKFVEFVTTSLLLGQQESGKTVFIFDPIGRYVAVIFFVIPTVAYVSFVLCQPLYVFMNRALLFAAALLAIVSSSYRIWNVHKVLKSKKPCKQHTCRVYERE